MPQAQPELKKVYIALNSLDLTCLADILQYMEKRLFVQLNGNRKVMGVLRGYDVGFAQPMRNLLVLKTHLGLPQRCS